MFPAAVPAVVIPSAEVTPSVAPDESVNVPPPSTVVEDDAICNVEPLLTVMLMTFDIVTPDV